jgi:sorting nexin-9/18/33
MAEMDIYHTQKVEDFTTLATDHLDGEIELYEQVNLRIPHQSLINENEKKKTQILLRLRTARRAFEQQQQSISPHPASDGTHKPSIYERDLEQPRLTPDPLPQPCPHVWDATPMRPVSYAIQEGVGLLLGTAANAVSGRGSVFGRFW